VDYQNAEGGVAQNFDWDAARYADDYSKEDSPAAYFFQKRFAVVMHFLRCIESGAILDVGCGPGIYAMPCTKRGFKYTGFDASHQMIEEGRKRFGGLKGVEFTIGDARHLPLPTDSFDGVLCLGMLEYVSQKDEAIYLQELARVAKPDGILIFSFLNARSPYWLWVDYAFPIIKFGAKNVTALLRNSKRVPLRDCLAEALPTRKFTLGTQVRVLRNMGLSVVGKIHFAPDVLPPQIGHRFPRHAVWLSSKLERLLQSTLFGWLGMAFVIAVRKPGLAHPRREAAE
jgi:ubiquinone/menaquinone biosynthesis C-methylase UbiE